MGRMVSGYNEAISERSWIELEWGSNGGTILRDLRTECHRKLGGTLGNDFGGTGKGVAWERTVPRAHSRSEVKIEREEEMKRMGIRK